MLGDPDGTQYHSSRNTRTAPHRTAPHRSRTPDLPRMMNTMMVYAVVLLAGCALAGRLENTYLPPLGAAQAGGAGAGLAAPFVTRSGAGTAASTLSASSYSASGASSGAAYQRPALIIKQLNDNPGDGTFSFSYETENGIQAEEQGQLRQDGAEGIESVRGAYAFTAPDNVRYSVSYTADENGFQAFGAHLPTAPPVPEAILKALEQNAADEARGLVDDGQYRAEHHGEVLRSGSEQSAPGGGYRY